MSDAPPPLYGADSMLFVYHFEANPEFGPAAAEILEAAEAGKCRLTASILALMEALVVPKRLGLTGLCRAYRDFFHSFPNLSVLPVDEAVAELASDLRARRGLRTPDAIHLASAIRAGADAFLSEDKRLPKLEEIRVARFHQARF